MLQLIFKAFPNPFDYVGYPIAQLSNETWDMLIEGGAAAMQREAAADLEQSMDGTGSTESIPGSPPVFFPQALAEHFQREAELTSEAVHTRFRQDAELAQMLADRLREAEARAVAAEASLREARAELECVVCLSRRKTMLMAPCNHLCACAECAARLLNAPCPICRGVVVFTFRVYQ